MWYETSKNSLDYRKPICCRNDKNNVLLLVPQIAPDKGDKTIGFNWLNTVTGEYQSYYFFETAKEACDSYTNYKPVNCTLNCDEV